MENSLFHPSSVMRSLVLAGGGIRLAYHAGVLLALEEAGLAFQHVDGTSGGIFGTAMLASGLSPRQVAERWRRLKVRHFASLTGLGNYLRFPRLRALGDTDGLRRHVFPTLGIDIDKIRDNHQFRATFNVCNFSRKTVESIPGSEATLPLLLAGVSLPILMPAIQIDGDWYTDAVWIKDANLMEAVKQGAEEVWVVYCIGNSRQYQDGAFAQYVHSIEMSAAGALLAELEWLIQVNTMILLNASPYGQQTPVRVRVLKPQFPLPLDPDLFIGHLSPRALVNLGYAETKAQLREPWPNRLPDYHTLQMEEPGTSLQYQAHFQGHQPGGGAMHLHALFDLRELPSGQMGVRFFGSLAGPDGAGEHPTCHHEASLASDNGRQVLEVRGECTVHGQPQPFVARFPLSRPSLFGLGLGIREVALQLGDHPPVRLREPLALRLVHAWRGKLYHNAGWWARWREKTRLKQKLVASNELGWG
jgi:predicted acylesterase/phospholipase RssA